MTPNNLGVLGKAVFLFVFLAIAGIGGNYVTVFVGPNVRAVLQNFMFGGLTLYIVRPRSADVDWKFQIGVGVGLIAALVLVLYFYGPASTVKADGTIVQSV